MARGVGPFQEASDSDSITTASSAASDAAAEYDVESIKAERPGPRPGQKEYLVKWAGYPLSACTWEPRTSFLSNTPLDEWREEKLKIQRGKATPFNVKEFEAEQRRVEAVRAERAERRRKKREKRKKRLAQQLFSSDEDDDDRPLNAINNSKAKGTAKPKTSSHEFSAASAHARSTETLFIDDDDDNDDDDDSIIAVSRARRDHMPAQPQPTNKEKIAPTNKEKIATTNKEKVAPINKEKVAPMNKEKIAPTNKEKIEPTNKEKSWPVHVARKKLSTAVQSSSKGRGILPPSHPKPKASQPPAPSSKNDTAIANSKIATDDVEMDLDEPLFVAPEALMSTAPPAKMAERAKPLAEPTVTLITDQVIQYYPREASQLVQTILRKIEKRGRGLVSDKIAMRPGAKQYLLDLVIAHKGDGKNPWAQLWADVQLLCPDSDDDPWSRDTNTPDVDAFLVSEPASDFQSTEWHALCKTDERRATEHLVAWFAGWTKLCNPPFAECIVCDSSKNDSTPLADIVSWSKRWPHLRIMTPSQCKALMDQSR